MDFEDKFSLDQGAKRMHELDGAALDINLH